MLATNDVLGIVVGRSGYTIAREILGLTAVGVHHGSQRVTSTSRRDHPGTTTPVRPWASPTRLDLSRHRRGVTAGGPMLAGVTLAPQGYTEN